MLNIKKIGNFKPKGKYKLKKQIILCHTSREVNEYLTSLNFRYNGKYDKVPNFVISRDGEVIQLLPESGYSNFFNNEELDKSVVLISLENLGWLEKKPLTTDYINWKGSIYSEQVYEKKWRDFFFWHPYTEEQLNLTANLCKMLTDELKVKKRCIGHNTKIEGIERYEGVVSRSNYYSTTTDLNPSFNFETFEKILENG